MQPNSLKNDEKIDQIGKLDESNTKENEATLYLNQKFGEKPMQFFIKIAQFCLDHIKEKQEKQVNDHLPQVDNSAHLSRDAKRNKSKLMEWYNRNFVILKPELDQIVIINEDLSISGEKKDEIIIEDSPN